MPYPKPPLDDNETYYGSSGDEDDDDDYLPSEHDSDSEDEQSKTAADEDDHIPLVAGATSANADRPRSCHIHAQMHERGEINAFSKPCPVHRGWVH